MFIGNTAAERGGGIASRFVKEHITGCIVFHTQSVFCGKQAGYLAVKINAAACFCTVKCLQGMRSGGIAFISS